MKKVRITIKDGNEMFLGISVDRYWAHFTTTLMEAHNTVVVLSKNNDFDYVCMMMGISDLLKPLFCNNTISYTDYMKFIRLFIFVMETKFCLKDNKNGSVQTRMIRPYDVFMKIVDNWNVDLSKEINNKNVFEYYEDKF